MKKKKCKQCGKEFLQVITGVNYCSGKCEKLAWNPVAKFARRIAGRHRPLRGKGSYTRKNRRIDFE